MCFKGKARANSLQILLVVLVVSSGCRGGPKALSTDEVLDANVPVPIYYPNPTSGYGDLEAVYYYSDDSSEGLLTTYFVAESPGGQTIRVARMSTCKYCGELIVPDEIAGQALVPIEWAQGDTVVCRAHPTGYYRDQFAGDPFQSCLFWLDGNGNQYKLYTVWSEEEAANFANELVVLGRSNE